MATLAKAISKDLFENILPTYGQQRVKQPVWDESQKMFIFDEYESASGHRYYSGLRFTDRMVIREIVGLYHNWTYIDSIEVYAFNGKKLELIQKKGYDRVFRSEVFVRSETARMLKSYLAGVLKVQRVALPEKDLEEQARRFVDSCYKSFLDADYSLQLTQILPKLLK